MKYGDKIKFVTNLLESVSGIDSIISAQSADVTSFNYFVDTEKAELSIFNYSKQE